MRNGIFLIFVFAVLVQACAPAFKIIEPYKTARENDQDDDALIAEGIRVFESGDYRKAAGAFHEALARNPDNLAAMYELAITYNALKKYDSSDVYCRMLFEYRSDFLARAYMISGTNADERGHPAAAVKYYEAGIEKFPNDFLLRYNLAVTQIKLKQNENAKMNLKAAITLRPSHPSSHIALGSLFAAENNRIPAIFAYTRFLILEPASKRSDNVRSALKHLLYFGVTSEDASSSRINIQINPNEPKNEGDFSGTTLLLSMSAALQLGKRAKGEISEKESLKSILESVFSFVSESKEKDNPGFVFRFYVPYYRELKNKGFVSILTDHIFQYKEEYAGLFLDWSGKYEWPERQ